MATHLLGYLRVKAAQSPTLSPISKAFEFDEMVGMLPTSAAMAIPAQAPNTRAAAAVTVARSLSCTTIRDDMAAPYWMLQTQ